MTSEMKMQKWLKFLYFKVYIDEKIACASFQVDFWFILS